MQSMGRIGGNHVPAQQYVMPSYDLQHVMGLLLMSQLKIQTVERDVASSCTGAIV